jgi:hypothetical protein
MLVSIDNSICPCARFGMSSARIVMSVFLNALWCCAVNEPSVGNPPIVMLAVMALGSEGASVGTLVGAVVGA